jgi:hypothetical protein
MTMVYKRLAVFALIVGLCTTHASAQFFGQLGNNLGGQQTRFLYADSVTESLYVVGGAYGEIGGVISPGVIRWDGISYHAVGCGFEWDCVSPINGGGLANPMRSMVRWNGDLYAGGDITTSNGVVINHVARFDGTNWQPLAGGTNGPVRSLRAFQDGLYAAGWFTYADTVLANGLARWDGTRWHNVHDLPRFMLPYDSLNYINDVAIYNDEVYVCGVFSGPGDIEELARFDGSAWVPVGQGIRGSIAKVLKLVVHDSLLYIAGAFANDGIWGPTTNPSNGIVAWDGTNWVELAHGTLGSSLPWLTDMAWRNDTLYACGDFDHIGGVDAGNLAYWDGQRWCGMVPDLPNTSIASLNFFRDTLYLGGFFSNQLDTARGVAKWLGGDHVEACGVPVGLPEPGLSPEFHVYPNPAEDLLQWTAEPGNINALVVDATGRVVRSDQHAQASIALHGLAPGCYTLLLSDVTRGTRRMARFIKR